jgi:putative nucleotidyltransferase with HDIG domain
MIIKTGVLDSLRNGAGLPLYSPDDWSAVFEQADDPFIEQLRAEWPLLTPPDALCLEMMDAARDHVLGAGESAPHLWAHILRVTGYAVHLAHEAHLPTEHAFMMGIFHDIGKLDESTYRHSHEEIGAVMAREMLRDHYPQYAIESIARAILKDSDGVHGHILHDADKLDKIGATGIMRRISGNPSPFALPVMLRKLREELRHFPIMHFPASEKFSALKKPFTRDFLLMVSDE